MIFNYKKRKKQQKYPLNTYKIDEITEELLNKFIKTDQLGGEVFGFEALIKPNQIEMTAFSPSIIRLDLTPSSLSSYNYSLSSAGYEVELENPSFLPLYSQNTMSILQNLQDIEVAEGYVFMQVLISKQTGNWREDLIDQYEHFLNGNENPAEMKIIRGIQSKVLKIFDKIGDFGNIQPAIPEVEEKILQPNYRVEMRFLIDSPEEKQICCKLNDILSQMNFYNQLNLYKVRDIEEFEDDLYQRRHSLNNFFSESELLSLILSERATIPQRKAVAVTKTPSSNDPLSNLPTGHTHSREIDKSIIKLLDSTLQSLDITKTKLKVYSFEQGATLQKLSISIPKETNYMKIEKQIKNIQANLGNELVSIEIGDKPNTANFYIPCANREVVYLRSIMETEEYQQFASKSTLPFVIGQDAVGNPMFADLQSLVHLLIAGSSGSGKSVFLNSLITSLLLNKSPEEMIMYLIDPKQVELCGYEGVPHVADVIDDMNKAHRVFESLIVEMERRYTLFAKNKVKDLKSYNSKSDKVIPYIVCVVDEYADLKDTNPEVESCIKRLGQKARAAGIHLIIATQRPSVEVITGDIKVNLPSKFCLRLQSSADYKTVFGKSVPFHLLGKGDGVAMIEGNIKEFERFQSPVISLDDQETELFLDGLKGNGVHEGIELVKEESSMDKLKRIIATNNESRLTHLQKEMKIRTEDVQALMGELISEGWLEKQGRSYKITASEDELKKWREE